MEIIKKEKNINNNKINDNKIKVAAYARVSTEHDDQINSFESQQKYYEEKINNNPDWELFDIYADEGISGTSTRNRVRFMKMLEDALRNKIDLILVKSISRFARNTYDTLKYVRMLKEAGVGIIFEEENIYTLDMNGELLLTVLSSIAEQESRNLSCHVKLGHEMLLKRGEVIFGNRCYGYVISNKDKSLTIIPEEANTVKKMFEMFADDKTFAEIQTYLKNKKVLSPKGLDTWGKSTIKRILENEKYCGDLLHGKYCKFDLSDSKSKRNVGQGNKYLIRNYHEPIVSRELYDKVQEKMKSRHVNSNPVYRALSFKTKCGYCGSSLMRHSQNKTGMVTKCTNRKKNGRDACPNSMNFNYEKLREIIFKELKDHRYDFKNNNDDRLSYFNKYVLSSKNLIDLEKTLDELVKYVIVGGYDDYGRVQPHNVRIIIRDSYFYDSVGAKKITPEEMMNKQFDILISEWVNKEFNYLVVENGKQHLKYKYKVKVSLELEVCD